MMHSEKTPIHQWLAEPVDTSIRQAIGRLAECEDVRQIAVMPDVHLAENVCVGLAVATTQRIYPDAVGGDIGCGMAAVQLTASASALRREPVAMELIQTLRRILPIGRRGGAILRPLPEALSPEQLSTPQLRTLADHDGRVQFGTLGRGNHFIEFQLDDEDRLWIMVHSGSRAMGPAIRQTHLAAAERRGFLPSLDAHSDAGQAYLRDADWAMRYAAGSRRVMLEDACAAAGEVLGAGMVDGTLIECCHNHVYRETHLGQELWVHRKGANRAGTDEVGVIPGSMGAPSFHVVGRGEPTSLCSSSHGAGRRLSRSAAKATITVRDLQRQMGEVWFDPRLAHELREEAPKAYRDILKVMRAQSDLVCIVRKLRPLLSYKG
jgi:tRNA-splicing ligase RtcB